MLAGEEGKEGRGRVGGGDWVEITAVKMAAR